MTPVTRKEGYDGTNVPKLAGKTLAPEMRRPPAYQTYASDDLASEAYYGMSLASRGLFDAMLRAIWVNGHVPKEPKLLARAIRADPAEIPEALVPTLLEQFVALDGDPSRLTCHELERQRSQLERRRELQRNGGKEGAKRRYSGSQSNSGKAIGQPMGPEMNCSEVQRAERKRTPSAEKRPSSGGNRADDYWRKDYIDAEGKWQ